MSLQQNAPGVARICGKQHKKAGMNIPIPAIIIIPTFHMDKNLYDS